MKVLVFDTETTGLPVKWAKVNEVDKWPHIIQLSHILYDTDTNNIIDIDTSDGMPGKCLIEL